MLEGGITDGLDAASIDRVQPQVRGGVGDQTDQSPVAHRFRGRVFQLEGAQDQAEREDHLHHREVAAHAVAVAGAERHVGARLLTGVETLGPERLRLGPDVRAPVQDPGGQPRRCVPQATFG